MKCNRHKCTHYSKIYPKTNCERHQVEKSLYTCDLGYRTGPIVKPYYGILPKPFEKR